jgi:hypothetical protein
MITRNSARTRLLLPLSAALLLHAGGTLASDPVDDAQAHAAALLSGNLTSHSGTTAKSTTVLESRSDLHASDAQVQARQLILADSGISDAPQRAAALHVKVASSSGLPGQQGGRAPADAQEMARWLLQGRPSEANVSSHPLRARPGTRPVAQRN